MSDGTSAWRLSYEGFVPEKEGLREALCVLGNGYMATRGALPEQNAGDVHYPGTYIAGVYNRLSSQIVDREVENESLVNVPNWLPLTVRIEGGPWLGDDEMTMLEHRLVLDMAEGVLIRESRFSDPDGRELHLLQRRIVSMRDTHLAALETTLIPVGWSGRIEVRSALDATVRNRGVRRYRDLPDQHLRPVRTDEEDSQVVCLHVATTQSLVHISQAARTRLFRDGEPSTSQPELIAAEGYVAHQHTLDVRDGEQIRVEKVVAVFTSRDGAIGDPETEACAWVHNVRSDFDDLAARHSVAWKHLWERVGLEIGVDGEVGRYLNLHLFHLLQTVSVNTIFLDVGVPARGLHGEAYRGHIFWDELFILPSLSLRVPQLARSLLLYRYRRIDVARHAAVEAGYRGAMFPWQSSASGREETQTMHLNPRSGRWLPDASHRQRHVNAAIAYNAWTYYQATGDVDFLTFFGAELILEIARFWASAATYDETLDRYEIKGVMGPDEYHERYPGSEQPGLSNNAYTNIMAVWCLCRAVEVLEILPPATAQELRERLELSDDELARWDEVSRRMRVCFHEGVISQFEGYEDLAELDWDGYRERYGDIARLDRILEAEGDGPNRYKLTKQADVMMLFYVLTPNGLASMLDRLGYDHDDDLLARTLAYYEPRTAHGSTLSRVVHAWVHARADRKRSWELFVEALHSDVDDIQGGTTAEGIHLGAMAGTVDLLQRCYTGLELTHDVLRLDPRLPDALGTLAFSIRYRTHLVHLSFNRERTCIHVDPDEGEAICVEIHGRRHTVQPGEALEVSR